MLFKLCFVMSPPCYGCYLKATNLLLLFFSIYTEKPEIKWVSVKGQFIYLYKRYIIMNLVIYYRCLTTIRLLREDMDLFKAIVILLFIVYFVSLLINVNIDPHFL